MNKKLYRSKESRVLSGVCGGLAEYFVVDPTIIRIVAILLSFVTSGLAVLIYIVGAIIMPEMGANDARNMHTTDADFRSEFKTDFKDDMGYEKEPVRVDSEKSKMVIGGVLIVIGIMLFVKQFFYWFDFKYIWPIIIIAVGAIIVYKGGWRKKQ